MKLTKCCISFVYVNFGNFQRRKYTSDLNGVYCIKLICVIFEAKIEFKSFCKVQFLEFLFCFLVSESLCMGAESKSVTKTFRVRKIRKI